MCQIYPIALTGKEECLTLSAPFCDKIRLRCWQYCDLTGFSPYRIAWPHWDGSCLFFAAESARQARHRPKLGGSAIILCPTRWPAIAWRIDIRRRKITCWPGLGRSGAQDGGLLIGGDGLFDFARLDECQAEIGVCGRQTAGEIRWPFDVRMRPVWIGRLDSRRRLIRHKPRGNWGDGGTEGGDGLIDGAVFHQCVGQIKTGVGIARVLL